jgi:type VI protein secretion system component Hcp
MILMRLNELGGLYCEIEGGNEYKYGDIGAGWFPIESMNFGVEAKSEAKAATKVPPNATPGKAPPPPPPPPGTKPEKEDHTFSSISVSKFVDMTTTWLMQFAMEDRLKTKDDKDNLRRADFHFLHSVKGIDRAGKDRHVFPYLMITLDNVLVTSWNITASGDDRPTESMTIKYDKAAMRYYASADGKVWVGGDCCGWDQDGNGPWTGRDVEPEFFKDAYKGRSK